MMRDVVAAALTGLTIAAISVLLLRPTRRLDARMAPYVQRSRVLTGQSADASLLFRSAEQPKPSGPFAPLVNAAARQLSSLMDVTDDEAIVRRLRQAGRRDMTPDSYRMRQLTSVVQFTALFIVFGLLISASGAVVLIAGLFGGIVGAARWRSSFDKAVSRRRERMRGEVYTLAQMLAIHMQAGTSPLVAIEGLARNKTGEIGVELSDAMDEIAAKASPRDAFERLASETAEPVAARVYRLLATSDTGAADTMADSLLHMANDLRTQRREDVERLAARRRFQMLIPMIVVMGPVLLLFLVAPLPTIVLGT